MNIALLSSTSPLGFRTQQTADFLKGASSRKNQGYPFPTPGSVTISNQGSTSHVISNYTSYTFVSGGPATPVVNKNDFTYFTGEPVMCGNTYPQYSAISSLTPTSINGFGLLGIEFVADTTAFEVGIYSRGFSIAIEVDGALVYASTSNQSQTAQAGASGTITLAASESATNNIKNGNYIYILSGTGAGQRKRVTAYNGTTKVATMDSNWTTAPDNTSVYVMGRSPVVCDSTYNSGNIYYPKITLSGERTSHLVRIYTENPVIGVYVDSSGSIAKPATSQKPVLFVVGDSFGEGTGAADASNAYGQLLAATLGFDFKSSCAGETGMTTNGSTKTTYKERTCPPVNAWCVNTGSPSSGTFTLTQGAVTTAAIAYNASVATMQTALDTAFGANQWRAVGMNTAGGINYLLLGINANATNTVALTMNSGSLVSPVAPAGVSQYLGDIAPYIPKDGFGNPLPFYILVQGSINDVSNYATLQAAATDLYASLAARFPTAVILATGTAMSWGLVASTWLSAETALENAAAALQNVNGKSPFLALFNKTTGAGYLTSGGENSGGMSTYHLGNPKGTAGYNVDQYVWTDGVHPSAWGHIFLADVMAKGFADILRL